MHKFNEKDNCSMKYSVYKLDKTEHVYEFLMMHGYCIWLEVVIMRLAERCAVEFVLMLSREFTINLIQAIFCLFCNKVNQFISNKV